jgi:hypothetical protein
VTGYSGASISLKRARYWRSSWNEGEAATGTYNRGGIGGISYIAHSLGSYALSCPYACALPMIITSNHLPFPNTYCQLRSYLLTPVLMRCAERTHHVITTGVVSLSLSRLCKISYELLVETPSSRHLLTRPVVTPEHSEDRQVSTPG